MTGGFVVVRNQGALSDTARLIAAFVADHASHVDATTANATINLMIPNTHMSTATSTPNTVHVTTATSTIFLMGGVDTISDDIASTASATITTVTSLTAVGHVAPGLNRFIA